MKLIPLPAIDSTDIYDTCLNSISSAITREKFKVIRNSILDAGQTYTTSAISHELYKIKPLEISDGDLVFGAVTKGDLNNLYTQQFVGKSKPARTAYDKLLLSAPLGRCPFCGFGQASTIDHFLPKAGFSWLSIYIPNLVPACKDCNHGKSTNTADSAEQQIIHPYFDDPRIEEDQWLFAEINQSSPIAITYFACPPASWGGKLGTRVINHLRDFELPRRYSLEAANELASLMPMMSSLSVHGTTAVKDHLDLMSKNETSVHKNSWKSALYQALAASQWYWSGGHCI